MDLERRSNDGIKVSTDEWLQNIERVIFSGVPTDIRTAINISTGCRFYLNSIKLSQDILALLSRLLHDGCDSAQVAAMPNLLARVVTAFSRFQKFHLTQVDLERILYIAIHATAPASQMDNILTFIFASADFKDFPDFWANAASMHTSTYRTFLGV
jgi:hypothetical protein